MTGVVGESCPISLAPLLGSGCVCISVKTVETRETFASILGKKEAFYLFILLGDQVWYKDLKFGSAEAISLPSGASENGQSQHTEESIPRGKESCTLMTLCPGQSVPETIPLLDFSIT